MGGKSCTTIRLIVRTIRATDLLLGSREVLSGSKAATSSHTVPNLPEYQSFLDKRVSGMDCVDEFNEVVAFGWMTREHESTLPFNTSCLMPVIYFEICKSS